MKIYVRILGTDTGDSTPSLFIHVENNHGAKRFLINCGEGTQRFCVQHNVRLSRFDHIFFTRMCWEQVGGLPGAILTLADANIESIMLSGPKHTANFLESTRYFISRHELVFSVREFIGKTGEIFSDTHGTFYPIVIKAKDHESERKDKEIDNKNSENFHIASMVECKDNVFNMRLATQYRKAVKNPISSPLSNPYYRHFPTVNPVDDCVCYAYHSPDIVGKFDAEKAKSLGVKPGIDFGKLSRGLSVTTQAGNVINPSDVIAPTLPGPIILIIHCPTNLHLQSLLNNPSFNSYQINGKLWNLVKLIIHITPNNILNSEVYLQWMSTFDSSVEHMIVNNTVCTYPVIFTSWTMNQIKLNHAYGKIFPLPFAEYFPKEKLPEKVPKNTYAADPLLIFNILPKQGWDNSTKLIQIDKDELLRNFSTEIIEILEKTKKEIQIIENKNLNNNNKLSPQFVFLGTVAAIPSKYRNVSSTFVHIPEYGNIFLDVGEGSYGQLFRRYSPKETNEHLLNLKIVFISHIHADHHLGLIRILSIRKKLVSEITKNGNTTTIKPVIVIGPSILGYWLSEYIEYENLDFIFYDANDMTKPKNLYSPLIESIIGFTKLQTVNVLHCPDAYGVVMKHKNGWKLVYSGDTRPCPELINFGHNADLVIHEATFEDELQNEAKDKMHSTTNEAIESFKKMNGRFLMMNHFSSRYPKVPVFDHSYKESVSVAFDLMSINFSDFEILPYLLPIMQAFFKEDEEFSDHDNFDNKSKDMDITSKKNKKRLSKGGSSAQKKKRI